MAALSDLFLTSGESAYFEGCVLRVCESSCCLNCSTLAKATIRCLLPTGLLAFLSLLPFVCLQGSFQGCPFQTPGRSYCSAQDLPMILRLLSVKNRFTLIPGRWSPGLYQLSDTVSVTLESMLYHPHTEPVTAVGD